MVIAKGDAREVGHTISDSSQYLVCIMFINLFSASIKLETSGSLLQWSVSESGKTRG